MEGGGPGKGGRLARELHSSLAHAATAIGRR